MYKNIYTYIYLILCLNRTIENVEDPFDGLAVAQKMWNQTFTGKVKLGALM